MSWLEFFGYFSSILVIISLMVTSVVKFRVINAVGSIFFVIFAILTQSYPAVAMNFGIVLIDLYHLKRIRNVKEHFELVIAEPDSAYFRWFSKRHKKEIAELDPEMLHLKSDYLLFYVRNDAVAGLLAWDKVGDSQAKILLDYVTPTFRDCKLGGYFFGRENVFFKSKGIRSFVTYTTSKSHESYLKKIDFESCGNGAWHKHLVYSA